LAEGREEGLAEGREETLETVVITSSREGLPVETIAKITGYTTDRIADILKQQFI
jgi:predicted transposase YdaD